MTRDPERAKARILAAAEKEFAAKGFAGARVDAIARRAHVNKRMLYHYFGNKQDLFREILRRTFTRGDAPFRAGPEDIKQRLDYFQAAVCANPQFTRLMEWEALEFGARRLIGVEGRAAYFAEKVEQTRLEEVNGYYPSSYLRAGQGDSGRLP